VNRGLIAILLLALTLRLGWVLTRPAVNVSDPALADQRDYLSIAQNVLAGRGLEFRDARFNDTVYAFRMPGYPLFLAVCGANERVARIVQALLDTMMVGGVYVLATQTLGFASAKPGVSGPFSLRERVGVRGNDARRSFCEAGSTPIPPHPNPLPEEEGRNAAAHPALCSIACIPLIAALAVAVNPYLIYFAGLLLSETLFITMLVWALVLLVPGGQNGRRLSSLGALLLLALAVLVRPSAIGLPFVLGAASVWMNRSLPSAYQLSTLLWRVLVRLAVAAALVFICLLPWTVRNRMVLGHWVLLDTNAGFTVYDGYNPNATGGSDQRFAQHNPELMSRDELSRSSYLETRAWDYIQAHPTRVMQLMGAKLARTWSPVPLSADYGKPSLRMIALGYSVPFDLLVLIGLFGGRWPPSIKIFLIAPALYLSIIHALSVGSLRYRIPAEPALAVLAAAGVAYVGSSILHARPNR
jgi:hypothetical protein